MHIPPIGTERLELLAILPEEFGRLEVDRADPTLWVDRNMTNPYRHLVDEPGPLVHRIPRVKANPEFAPYAVRLAVLRDTRTIIGSAGFHQLPDERGMIEIGLEIVEPMRRQGYARELVHGMWDWVIEQPNVRVLRYSCGVHNAPSQALVKSLDFTHVNVQIDEEDGPEDVYEMNVTEYRQRFTQP